MFPARIPIVSNPPSGFNTYSLDFDGTDDYVDCGNGSSLQITGTAITVSAWINADSFSGNPTFVANTTASTWANGHAIYGTASYIYFTINGYSTNRAQVSTPSSGAWHHIVGVYDGTTIQIYLNATAGTAASYDQSIGNSANTVLGTNNGENGTWCNGKLDEVAIWDSALSSGSVSNIYNSGVPTDLLADSNSGDLQGWWRFEEGSGTSVADSSTNSNTGTLTNGPAHSTDVPS